MIVHRITGTELFGGASTVKEFRQLYGEVVTDKGYTSSELNARRDLTGQYGTEHEKQVIMHIKTPSGKGIGQYVGGVSNANKEQEFLFNRGSSFKVLGAYELDGRVHVNVKYVGRSVGGKGKTKR